MILFLRHQHPIGRKPPNAEAGQAELATHRYSPGEDEIIESITES